MRVAFIARSTLFGSKGGDTCQALETARHLGNLGVVVECFRADQTIDYDRFDIIHFFNLTRPADILSHTRKTHKPYVISPIWINYSEYDSKHRESSSGYLFKLCSPDQIAYLKTIVRWLKRKDALVSRSFLWMGQKKSTHRILAGAAQLLPNSNLEAKALQACFRYLPPMQQVMNGIDPEVFSNPDELPKDNRLVLCVARIEGLKNQLNLIRALNNTDFRLWIIGAPASNQQAYYKACVAAAAPNVKFFGHLDQPDLVAFYKHAAVHVLPSWFETCGLASLEAAAMGCNIVITDKGYTREYFEDYAFYCDPASPASIRQAVEKAAGTPYSQPLRDKILKNYTWQKAAEATLSAYHHVLQNT